MLQIQNGAHTDVPNGRKIVGTQDSIKNIKYSYWSVETLRVAAETFLPR